MSRYTEDRTLSALDDAAAALSDARGALRVLWALLGYTMSDEQRREIRRAEAAIDRALDHHRKARQEAGRR